MATIESAVSHAVSQAMLGVPPRQAKDDPLVVAATRALEQRAHQQRVAGAVAEAAVVLPDPVPVASVGPAGCSVCEQPIAGHHDVVRRAGCGHASHLACTVPLIRAGRQYCSKCPAPAISEADARAAGGYATDAGNDVDVRAAVVQALEYHRNQVRAAGNRAGPGSVAGRTDLDPFRARDAAVMQRTGWAVIGREPGGAPPPGLITRVTTSIRARFGGGPPASGNEDGPVAADQPVGGWTCTDPGCGGPRYCVHRFLQAIDTRAVLAWHRFDLPAPVPPGSEANVARARACVEALLAARAHPADMRRCGADAERLTALGYTVEGLVGQALPLQDLVTGLDLTWPRLLALAWHPGLLADRDLHPVVTLAKPPVRATAQRLLDAFPMGFDTLYGAGITVEELYVLGFTAPVLVQLGMRREQVANLMMDAGVVDRGGPAWFCRHFGLTPGLFASMPVTMAVINQDRHMQAAYTGLVLHLRADQPTRKSQ